MREEERPRAAEGSSVMRAVESGAEGEGSSLMGASSVVGDSSVMVDESSVTGESSATVVAEAATGDASPSRAAGEDAPHPLVEPTSVGDAPPEDAVAPPTLVGEELFSKKDDIPGSGSPQRAALCGDPEPGISGQTNKDKITNEDLDELFAIFGENPVGEGAGAPAGAAVAKPAASPGRLLSFDDISFDDIFVDDPPAPVEVPDKAPVVPESVSLKVKETHKLELLEAVPQEFAEAGGVVRVSGAAVAQEPVVVAGARRGCRDPSWSQESVVPQESAVPQTPVVPQEPVVPPGPLALQESLVLQEPVVPQEPLAFQAPVVLQVPQEPVVPQAPFVPQEPVAPQEPFVPQEPFALQAPFVPQEPLALQAPFVPQEPLAPDEASPRPLPPPSPDHRTRPADAPNSETSQLRRLADAPNSETSQLRATLGALKEIFGPAGEDPDETSKSPDVPPLAQQGEGRTQAPQPPQAAPSPPPSLFSLSTTLGRTAATASASVTSRLSSLGDVTLAEAAGNVTKPLAGALQQADVFSQTKEVWSNFAKIPGLIKSDFRGVFLNGAGEEHAPEVGSVRPSAGVGGEGNPSTTGKPFFGFSATGKRFDGSVSQQQGNDLMDL